MPMTPTPPADSSRALVRLSKICSFVFSAPLAPLTTFAIGGPAELLIEPASEEEASAVLDLLAGEGIPWRVLGGGSNLLVSDAGVAGAVVRMASPFDGFRFEGRTLFASPGARLSALARAAAERGMSGLEFAAFIPGTAGGAAATNAGASGGEMAGVVSRVRAHRPGTGRREYAGEECCFAYRSSRFLAGGEAILEVVCELEPSSPEAVRNRMREIGEERKRKFPLGFPSAGSVFKNPPGGSAGRLIEAAGLKGARRGGARISEMHANWIVNLGSARSDDVRTLIDLARARVREESGVALEPEIVIWDD